MGNVISDPLGIIKEDTILSTYIVNWALNNYPPNNTNQPLMSQALKKRACCTRQEKIPIALPGIDKNNKIQQYAVQIPIFDTQSNINASTCKLPYSGKNLADFSYDSVEDNFVLSGKQTCQDFYHTLCPDVVKKRSNYPSSVAKSYGPNPDHGTTSEYQQVNAYLDCNCENSFYKLNAKKVSAAGGSSNNVSPDQMAQTLDARCNYQPVKTFKVNKQVVTSLCINSIQTGDISASDQASLGMNQSCSSTTNNQQGSSSSASTPSAATSSNSGTSTSTSSGSNTSAATSADTGSNPATTTGSDSGASTGSGTGSGSDSVKTETKNTGGISTKFESSDTNTQAVNSNITDKTSQSSSTSTSTTTWIIVGVIIGLLLLMVGGYFAYSSMTKKGSRSVVAVEAPSGEPPSVE